MSLAGTGMTAVATVGEVTIATDLPRPILGGGGVGIKVFFYIYCLVVSFSWPLSALFSASFTKR